MWRPCGVIDDSYQKDLAIVRTRLQWVLMSCGLLVLFMMPYWCPSVWLNTVNHILITIVAVQGVNILIGMTGQITLGQSAFMAVGAYSMVLMVKYLGLSFWIATPIAMLISGVAGVIVGLPSLRVKGFYLALATLAAQFIIPWIIVNVRPDLTGGTDTLSVDSPSIGTLKMFTQERLLYLCLTAAILSTYFARNIQRSRFGRAFIAVRDNDVAAEILGLSVVRIKLLSFFICSVYAGLAGILYAIWTRGISVDHFTLHESIWYLGMLIVGGMGSVPGAVFGTIMIRCLDVISAYVGPAIGGAFPEEIGNAIEVGISPILFGSIVLVSLILEPRGLAHAWERLKSYYRCWPFSY